MTTDKQTKAALDALLERQAEANATIRPAHQALDTLEGLETKCKPTEEGNQNEE